MAGRSSTGGGSNSTIAIYDNGTLNNTTGRKNWIGVFTKLAFILTLSVVCAVYAVSKKPHLKTQWQERFQLLRKDKNLYDFVFSPIAKKSQKNKDEENDIFLVTEKNVETYPIDSRFLEAFYNTKGWKDTGDVVDEWEEAFKKRFRQKYLTTAEYADNERFSHDTQKRYTIEIPDPYTDHDHNNNNNDDEGLL
mmetsp:Transcript_35134/g.39945  ORF Transcript_35134/g.39945 Transcript_35134/m.39945 type:complete len:193 (+) Transcript_35134:100-678(+)